MLVCSIVSNSLDPVYYSSPVSSVHCIFQARILEWVAFSYSRRSSWPRYFPGKNIGVGCLFLLQEILLIQISNPCLLGLLHQQVDSFYHCATWEALSDCKIHLVLYQTDDRKGCIIKISSLPLKSLRAFENDSTRGFNLILSANISKICEYIHFLVPSHPINGAVLFGRLGKSCKNCTFSPC